MRLTVAPSRPSRRWLSWLASQAAGFEFEDYSDLHFRADDELEYEVGRRSVSGNTDRFTLKFRKP